MLHILVPALTPRLRYTFGVLAELWGIEYELLPAETETLDGPVLYYGDQPRAGAVSLPAAGWLMESEIRSEFAPWRWRSEEELHLFPQAEADGYAVAFDLPAAVFYLLSGYEGYVAGHYDAHERYDPEAYPSAHWRLAQVPWVYRWAEQLWAILSEAFPRLERRAPGYDYAFTVDIDAPWKHRHKGALLAGGGLGRAVLRGHWNEVSERLRSLWRGRDPYHTFDLLREWLPQDKTTFFSLLARHSRHDTRFTWQHEPYRALLRSLASQGYSLGIHPSYLSFRDAGQISTEVGHLHRILDRPITRSRQHFLRYRLPDTFRYLLAAGIRDEYSLCRFQSGGFPHGMARPFLWFDLEANVATDLTLHPTLLMDRTLQQYLGLTPPEAVAYARRLVGITREVGGVFTLLLHNDSLSESGEWQGWREAIRQIVAEVRSSG
jgi:hypothetical protein